MSGLEQISEAPAWFIDLVCGYRLVEQPLEQIARDAIIIPEGQRNSTLFKFGRDLLDGGLPPDQLTAQLITLNQQRCNPPLALEEVNVIAMNAAKYKPGTGRRATAITGGDSGLRWVDIPAWKRNQHIFEMKDRQVG